MKTLGLLLAMMGLMVSASVGFAGTHDETATSDTSIEQKDGKEKKQEDRLNAINRALELALKERAKSQSEYDRTKARSATAHARLSDRDIKAGVVNLDLDTRDNRQKLQRESREEQRRQQRLNWLND